MAHFYLIRHGQAAFGQRNYDVLSPLGHRQAALVGGYLAMASAQPVAMVSGEMERQKDSLTAAANKMTDPPAAIADAAFNEYNAEGIFKAYLPRAIAEDEELRQRQREIFKERPLFQKAFARVASAWLGGEAHDLDRLESFVDFRQRVLDGLKKLNAEYDKKDHIALFTSGGPISIAVGAALGLNPDQVIDLSWGVYNASITEIRYRQPGPYLMGYNNIAHLRLALEPELITHR